MALGLRRSVLALLVVAPLSACVSINSITPDSAAPGDVVWLHLSNVIGPTSGEPGATVTFDGKVMPLDPDTASVVAFEVPEGTADGTYEVAVRDGPGVFEIITIVALLRFRSDSATLVIGDP